MSEISFQWNTAKAASNRRKHGVCFDEAKSVFLDEGAKLISDPEHTEDEERFVILGLSEIARLLLDYCSIIARLLVGCHCDREDERVIRLISARRATRSESKQYRGR